VSHRLDTFGLTDIIYICLCIYRLSELALSEPLQNGWRNITRGDCIVGFSRKKLYKIKRSIENATGLKVCIVYGSLPPETRKNQAILFNTPNNNYDVLVATDAIGMGLNLNIRRIVFSDVVKFDGTSERLLLPTEVWQIAGRAGRYKSQYPKGYVTTLFAEDVDHLRECFQTKPKSLPKAGLSPTLEQLTLVTLILIYSFL